MLCTADAVLIVEVYAKKTAKIPNEVIARCKKRLKDYEDTAKTAQAKKDKGESIDGR